MAEDPKAPGGESNAVAAEVEGDFDLHLEIRRLLVESPNLAEAGPKAVVGALHERGFTVSVAKGKRALQDVKKQLAAREATALARRRTAYDCPGGHGLSRFLTRHDGFCCDTCRVYQPLGSPMWGCRQCDWDVCEARCRPKDSQTIVDLRGTMRSLEKRVEDATSSTLAQIEAEVHQLEKVLDAADLASLVKLEVQSGREPITLEAMRLERKALLKDSETLLSGIDARFMEFRKSEGGG